MSKKTSLYRYFDEADELLYVGIALNPATRLGQHKADKDITQVRHIEIEWFDNRALASAAEKWAIIRERPKWNRAGARRPRALKRTPKKALKPTPVAVVPDLPQMESDSGIWLDRWSDFIGPPAPYYFLAFSNGATPDDENDWRSISPTKAFLLLKFMRPGDFAWFEGDAPEGFWDRLSERRCYRWPNTWVRDRVKKHTGSAARTKSE